MVPAHRIPLQCFPMVLEVQHSVEPTQMCLLCHSWIFWVFSFPSKVSSFVDPLKVQAISELPPPWILHQLQSLKGKENFINRFVLDYATIAHGFLCMLRTDIPMGWMFIALILHTCDISATVTGNIINTYNAAYYASLWSLDILEKHGQIINWLLLDRSTVRTRDNVSRVENPSRSVWPVRLWDKVTSVAH